MDDYKKTLNALEAANLRFSLGQNMLLVGIDSFLIESIIRQIKTMMRSKTEFDTIIVYADEVSAGELAEHLDTFTIFSANKLVIIKNTEQLRKNEIEIISAYFDAPAENQSLIIVIDKFDARLSAWKKITSASIRINCDPPKWGSEIRSWLNAELKRMGKSMTPKAMDEFSSRIELDYFSAANELNKINLLAGDRKTFTEEDVFASLGTTRTGTLIDFYRALGKRNPKTALLAVELMLSTDWEPLQIFFQLYRFYSILYKIQLLRKAHVSDSEITVKHIAEVFMSQRKEYLDFASAYSTQSLESIMGILLDTDAKLKSSNLDGKLILGLAIIAILETK